jgi:pimeloyl-ACP methyl ester carboxylesterase
MHSDWDLTDTFDFRGHQVRYAALGDGDPLVLLHGTPFSSVVWRRIAPQLALRRRVYYFDLLGYGQSAKADEVSLGVQNQLFDALLEHWGLDRPDVVAHDFGGATALRTHLLSGRDYRTLTLIDPVALAPSGSALIQTTRQHEKVFAGLPGYLHEAVLRAYIAGRCIGHCPSRRCGVTSCRGWGKRGNRRSTGRSPRWTTGTSTRSSRTTTRSAARSPSCGASRTPGSRWQRAAGWSTASPAPHSG